MKSDVFLSNEEYLQQQNILKNRQQRIVQVREQSKRMAAAIITRMKEEAEKQYQQTENRVLSEIRQHYSRELATIRQHYNQCISDINHHHYSKHSSVNPSIVSRKSLFKNSVGVRRTEETELMNKMSKSLVSESQSCENQRNKKASIQSDVEKVSSTSPTTQKKRCKNVKPSVADNIFQIPENIVTVSDENKIQSSKDNPLLKTTPSHKKNTNQKKSVMFVNKENYDGRPIVAGVKRYPSFVRKPTHDDLSKPQVFDSNIIHCNGPKQSDANEIYNRLVHDRIRVLEQKEKILRRRSPVSFSISNSVLNCKPTRFSDYFFNFHDHNMLASITDNERQHNIPNEISIPDISNDMNRVRTKKKLLVLELSNAETQTDQNTPTPNDFSVGNSEPEKEKRSIAAEESRLNSDVTKSPKINSRPSPIPKDTEDSDNKALLMKKPRSSKQHVCKRKQYKSKGVTVTVTNNQTEVSTNSSDTNSSSRIENYPTALSSVESDVGFVENSDSRKSVKVIVNFLSGTECKEKKSKNVDKRRNVTYMIPANYFKKVPNWRKLFDNDEKMTESSYFSPPDTALKKQNTSVKRLPKSCEVTAESISDDKSHNLGYYVQKLLLMRPESIENLDVSSCSTNKSDETVPNVDKNTNIKHRFKIPLYQNSFDDSKVVNNPAELPYYQNSFDDTMDAVCEFMLNSCPNDFISKDDSTSIEDESADVSSVCEKNFLSSVPESSKNQTENSPHSSPGLKSETGSKLPKDLFERSFSKSIENVRNSCNETDEDQLKLPTIEELLKHGFISELMLNQETVADHEILEEEEFLRQLLTVNIQPRKADDKKLIVHVDPEGCQVQNASAGDAYEQFPQKTAKSSKDLKREHNLLGWIDATVQRTLQASAINSTSSGDNSDPLRQTHKALENLIEESLENSAEGDSLLFSERFTLSPIKMPDIHLSIPPTSKI